MPASIKHLTNIKLKLTSLLARWTDGLYYTAAVVECDKVNKRCLVCFEDGSEVWVNNRDVHLQLSLDQLSEDEDIVCCICDDGSSEPPNEIILCDLCQQGYHQKCHTPAVDSSKIDESDGTDEHKDWLCSTCSYILNQSSGPGGHQAQSRSQQQEPKQQSQPKQPLPQPPPLPAKQPQHTKPQQRPQPQQPQPQSQPQPQPQAQPNAATKPIPKQEPQSQAAKPFVKTTKSAPTTVAPPVKPPTSTVGPVKASANHQVQKAAPYYPLTSQARVAPASTAALASMTASSALVVGKSAGRTKQDLVTQSNKSSQRRVQATSPAEAISASAAVPLTSATTAGAAILASPQASIVTAAVASPPVKHAVRKSSVNFPPLPPVRQSALPTATRSLPAATLTTLGKPTAVYPDHKMTMRGE